MKQSFYQYSYEQLKKLFIESGLNESGANLIYNSIYKKKNRDLNFEGLAKKSHSFCLETFDFTLPEVDTVQQAQDGTTKLLFKLSDGAKIESVLIPFNGKFSICLSSQVGCAMNCSFCFTGTQGLTRSLETHEIIGQFLKAWHWLDEHHNGVERIKNIVFMGQGEPLHNFDNVKNACDIFVSQYGTSIGYQKITISTAGYVPGLKRWKNEIPGVNLALSLHSTFDQKRSQLIPINTKWPLEELLTYIDEIPLSKKQFVTYEYLLAKDFNDGDEDAHALGKLLSSRPAYVNIIPFNPFPGSQFKRPELNKINNFKSILDTYKIPTLIRITKGDDVLAACGQLNTK